MKYRIEKIYPGSAFRLYFFITLITGGAFALIFLFVSIFLGIFWLGLLVFTAGVPLLAVLTGGLVYIDSHIYTLFAEKFGGISIELKKDGEA